MNFHKIEQKAAQWPCRQHRNLKINLTTFDGIIFSFLELECIRKCTVEIDTVIQNDTMAHVCQSRGKKIAAQQVYEPSIPYDLSLSRDFHTFLNSAPMNHNEQLGSNCDGLKNSSIYEIAHGDNLSTKISKLKLIIEFLNYNSSKKSYLKCILQKYIQNYTSSRVR